MISKEPGTIYRVGRRRFLTERAAFKHMARLRLASMRECACEAAEYDDNGLCYFSGYTCPIHDARIRQRYTRLLRRAWKRGWRPEERQHAPRDPGLHILQHALGLDDYGQGEAYRNHYVANVESDSYTLCMSHVEAGRMTRHGPSEMFGGGSSYCFAITDVGRKYVREHSPRPPQVRMTRSQRRYREFLQADCGLSFGDWLRSRRS